MATPEEELKLSETARRIRASGIGWTMSEALDFYEDCAPNCAWALAARYGGDIEGYVELGYTFQDAKYKRSSLLSHDQWVIDYDVDQDTIDKFISYNEQYSQGGGI